MSLKKYYNENGYLYKFRAFNLEKASALVNEFNNNYHNHFSPHILLKNEMIYKVHLLFKSYNEILFDKVIKEKVEEILGKDIVCWNSLLFYKKNAKFVSFHQDLKYWQFKNSDCLTVSLALTESTKDNGCLVVVPKSHLNQEVHIKEKSSDNLLANFQSVNVENKKRKFLELEPGEFSIHHGNILHGSYANKTNKTRILLALRFAKSSNSSKIYKTATYINSSLSKNYISEPIINKNFDKEALKYREKLLKETYVYYFKKKFHIFNFKLFLYLSSNLIIRYFYYLFFRK